MLNVYVVKRIDEEDYDECTEQTIVAIDEKRALELASQQYGQWEISQKVDLTKEGVLTQHYLYG